MRADGAEGVNRNGGIGTIQVDDAVLADFAVALVRARDVVVVEEGIMSRAVDQDVLGVDDAQTPGVGRGDLGSVHRHGLGGELRVEQSGVVREWQRCRWVGLIVGCFGLDL